MNENIIFLVKKNYINLCYITTSRKNVEIKKLVFLGMGKINW